MAETPIYKLPYPVGPDQALVPKDMQSLAVKVDYWLNLHSTAITDNQKAITALTKRVKDLEDAGNGAAVGSLLMWAGTNPWSLPPGYLECASQRFTTNTYPNLYKVIGRAYSNTGDPGNTYRLPMFYGRIPMGRSQHQAEFNTVGKTGGYQRHTIPKEALPNHRHTIHHNHAAVNTDTTGGHWHEMRVDWERKGKHFGISDTQAREGKYTDRAGMTGNGAHKHVVDLPYFVGTSGWDGAGQTMYTMPPYMVVQVLIKVA